jgi:hypothetical protein
MIRETDEVRLLVCTSCNTVTARDVAQKRGSCSAVVINGDSMKAEDCGGRLLELWPLANLRGVFAGSFRADKPEK